MNPNLKAHIFLFIVAVIYGLNYIVAKEVMPVHMSPETFVLLRIGIACAMFWGIQALLKGGEKVQKKDLITMGICGFFGAALNMSLFFQGLSITSPINASIIMTTNPILVLITAFILLKEPLTARKWSGILLGMGAAIALIYSSANTSIGRGNFLGDILVFFNALSYGIYLVMVKPLMLKYRAFTVIKWVFLFGLMFVLPFGIGGLTAVQWIHLPSSIWMAIAFVIIGTTFFTYLLNIAAMKVVSPSVVSVYIYLQPLLAGFFSILLGKDQLDIIKIICAFLIFTGVYLVSSPQYKKVKSQH